MDCKVVLFRVFGGFLFGNVFHPISFNFTLFSFLFSSKSLET